MSPSRIGSTPPPDPDVRSRVALCTVPLAMRIWPLVLLASGSRAFVPCAAHTRSCVRLAIAPSSDSYEFDRSARQAEEDISIGNQHLQDMLDANAPPARSGNALVFLWAFDNVPSWLLLLAFLSPMISSILLGDWAGAWYFGLAPLSNMLDPDAAARALECAIPAAAIVFLTDRWARDDDVDEEEGDLLAEPVAWATLLALPAVVVARVLDESGTLPAGSSWAPSWCDVSREATKRARALPLQGRVALHAAAAFAGVTWAHGVLQAELVRAGTAAASLAAVELGNAENSALWPLVAAGASIRAQYIHTRRHTRRLAWPARRR